MINISNKSDEEVKLLIEKHSSLLELSKVKSLDEIPVLAIIYDIGIEYLKPITDTLMIDWKAWAMVVLKKKYFNGEINTENDVIEIINEFILYLKINYEKYSEDSVWTDEYEKNGRFTYQYIKQKMGG